MWVEGTCIRRWSTSDESIRSRAGYKSAMRPFAKLLWTFVVCTDNDVRWPCFLRHPVYWNDAVIILSMKSLV